jgi:hypothetical protein
MSLKAADFLKIILCCLDCNLFHILAPIKVQKVYRNWAESYKRNIEIKYDKRGINLFRAVEEKITTNEQIIK